MRLDCLNLPELHGAGKEAAMRLITSAVVCLAVLYFADMYYFNGTYTLTIESMISQISTHF